MKKRAKKCKKAKNNMQIMPDKCKGDVIGLVKV
jgi:hypothetical protein